MEKLESLTRMSKDIKLAASTLTDREARFLVDTYYQMQDNRIRVNNQVKGIERFAVKTETEPEPHITLDYVLDNAHMLEDQIKGSLKNFAESRHMGVWAMQHKGIAHILAAGLIAHIDITKTKTAGGIWRYAGQDPTSEWKKGEKRPWNASLKTLCYKIGESFVKVCNKEEAFYGHIYQERKALEIKRNEAGEFKAQAEAKLAKCKIGKSTDAYKAYIKGILPPAHIQSRAKRYAVKLFLAHWFEEAYRNHYGEEPPIPYPIAHLNHVHRIEAPTY